MITFETFKDIDDAGVETWRAYFSEECDFAGTDMPMPHHNASVGYGDTEYEAVANLCLDEMARIEQEEEAKRITYFAPLTNGMFTVLRMLRSDYDMLNMGVEFESNILDYLAEHNLVYGIVRHLTGTKLWYITYAGIQYMDAYKES